MILTRRGFAVLGVVAFGVLNATLYGPRALNAIVAPAGVALLAAILLVRRVDEPELKRVVVDEGFVGETHTVELRFDSETSFTGHVVDEVPERLVASGNELTTAIEDTTVAYDLTFTHRGAYDLGPTRVLARDVLGLAEREFRYRNARELLVFPRVHDITGSARHELNLLPDVELVNNRGAFDTLREYQRGDSLRDIDWKKSAKATGDDLIVKEYVDEADLGEVFIAAETVEDPGGTAPSETGVASADAMAEAAASIAAFLLDAGLSVGVSAPSGTVMPGQARDQRTAILEALARAHSGQVWEQYREDADLVIRADGREVTVGMGDEEVSFARLAGDDAVVPPEPTVAARAGD